MKALTLLHRAFLVVAPTILVGGAIAVLLEPAQEPAVPDRAPDVSLQIERQSQDDAAPQPPPVAVRAVRHVPAVAAEQAPQKPEPASGPELVKAVQRGLNHLGYSAGPVDGLMGPKTRAAINAFQRDAGLTPDGRATRALVRRILAKHPPPAAETTSAAASMPTMEVRRSDQ